MEERVYGAAVIAAVFRRPDGRIFFVKRKGKDNLTFPTGHMKRADGVLGRTLFRESQEEVLGERGNGGDIQVRGILDVFVRLGQDETGEKIITLYLCDTDEETAQEMIYEELGEILFVWLDPQIAPKLPLKNPSEFGIEAKVNLPLDELAVEGLKIYNKEYNVQKEEGKMPRFKLGEKFLAMFKLIFRKT